MITSVNNKTIKNLMKLKSKKYRDETGMFLVDGRHMTEEAIKASRAETIITCDPDYQSPLKTLYVSEPVMEKLSFTKTPQPYMAVCHKGSNELHDVSRTLILDGVQDPGNVGTMIRSALAFGFEQIILSADSADLYNDKTLRSTQGAVFMINIIRADLKTVIPKLKDHQVRVIGSALRNAQDISSIQASEKMAFVMGNEGQGMKEETLDLCDQTLYIPISTMESLNVGVAAGIIMYTFRR